MGLLRVVNRLAEERKIMNLTVSSLILINLKALLKFPSRNIEHEKIVINFKYSFLNSTHSNLI